jgi:hypothetical protein
LIILVGGLVLVVSTIYEFTLFFVVVVVFLSLN